MNDRITTCISNRMSEKIVEIMGKVQKTRNSGKIRKFLKTPEKFTINSRKLQKILRKFQKFMKKS